MNDRLGFLQKTSRFYNSNYSSSEESQALYKLVTSYAAIQVEKEFHATRQHKIMVTSEGTNYVIVDSENIKIVDQIATSCSCTFYSSNMLPCRHIFAVRIKYDMCLISEDMIAKRWLKNFQSVQSQSASKPSVINRIVKTPTKRNRILSTPQKYSRAGNIAKDIASLITQLGTSQFHHCLQQLQTLHDFWIQGIDVTITPASKQDSSLFKTSATSANENFNTSVSVSVETNNMNSSNEKLLPVHTKEGIGTSTSNPVCLSDINEEDEKDAFSLSPSGISQEKNISSCSFPNSTNKIVLSSCINEKENGNNFQAASSTSLLPVLANNENKDSYNSSLPVLPLPCNATSTAGINKKETTISTSATDSCDSRSNSELKVSCSANQQFVLRKRLKLRGRPAGLNQTVIGLPKCKKRKPFNSVGPNKQKMKWMLSRKVAISSKDLCRSVGGTSIKNCNLKTLEENEWLDDQVCAFNRIFCFIVV